MPLNPDMNAMLDALTVRSIDMLDARSWLLRFARHNDVTVPVMPLIDADGDPVVVALVWWLDGVPYFIAEFDNGERRFKIYDGIGVWNTVSVADFERTLVSFHDTGHWHERGEPDTGGSADTDGALGITVVRGGNTIPVDPATGLAKGVLGTNVADEAETFLRESTRGDD